MGVFKGFTDVQLRKPKRSKFDLSHEKRLSTRMGRLTPVFISETIPNDTFKCNTEVLLRLAPLLAPIMHRVNVFIHYFFIPNRLLWREWEDFITNGRLGTESPPVPPSFDIDWVQGSNSALLDDSSLADYLGLGNFSTGDYTGRQCDLMPFLAYFKVWEDYYRDRNYVADSDLLPVEGGDFSNGSDLLNLLALKTRHYQKEYFTSALPWTQRGDAVLMPIMGSGEVNYMDVAVATVDGSPGAPATPDGDLVVSSGNIQSDSQLTAIKNIEDVDITSSGVTINELRMSIRLQEWLERNALAGSRYNESIMAHFARKTSDSRLQRAEYLGGGKVSVQISEVLTTAYSEDADTNIIPPANMAGRGFVLDGTPSFKYNCEEHGFILGILSVMPTVAYMQGSAKRFFGRNTFLDYPWPSFANLGEQEVKKYELYTDPAAVPADRATAPLFGYQSRYSDWKYIPSSSHGDFKSTLEFWHLTRKFSSLPALGNSFCEFEDSLQDRIFAVTGGDTCWLYLYNRCSVVRALPYFGTPLL